MTIDRQNPKRPILNRNRTERQAAAQAAAKNDNLKKKKPRKKKKKTQNGSEVSQGQLQQANCSVAFNSRKVMRILQLSRLHLPKSLTRELCHRAQTRGPVCLRTCLEGPEEIMQQTRYVLIIPNRTSGIEWALDAATVGIYVGPATAIHSETEATGPESHIPTQRG